MKTLTVSLNDRSYPIFIGDGVLARAGELLRGILPARRALIVTDTNAGKHYAAALQASLAAAGMASELVTLPAGEATKSQRSFENLLETLLAFRPERETPLIALGGGVIGDITGFAASVLLRGVPFVQAPTTLLAQVDSSVGGKTGINSAHGKNLIGTFYQPKAVLADTATLKTLPRREMLAGYAEIVKYGLLGAADFFAWLEGQGLAVVMGEPQPVMRAVETSCRTKAAIVAEDERESGRRALLNLGHTFAHALEKETGYGDQLLHGEAVAIGMRLAVSLSVTRGVCPVEDEIRIERHFSAVGLPYDLRAVAHAWKPAALAAHCLQDKKVKDGRLRFILLRGIGQAFIADDVTREEVEATFRRFL